jgi:hypothetical protein
MSPAGICDCYRADLGVRPADARRPAPGGWNRIQLVVEDLAAEVARLRSSGVRFRNDVVTSDLGPDTKPMYLTPSSSKP